MKRILLLLVVTISTAAFAGTNTTQKANNNQVSNLEDSIKALNHKIDSLQGELVKCDNIYTVAEFFANQEASIFDKQSVEKVASIDSLLTPEQKKQFVVVQKIANLKELLSEVKNTIKEKEEQNKDLSREQQNQIISWAIKTNMDAAGKLIDELQKCDTSFLSSVQTVFYNDLSSGFNELLINYLM